MHFEIMFCYSCRALYLPQRMALTESVFPVEPHHPHFDNKPV